MNKDSLLCSGLFFSILCLICVIALLQDHRIKIERKKVGQEKTETALVNSSTTQQAELDLEYDIPSSKPSGDISPITSSLFENLTDEELKNLPIGKNKTRHLGIKKININREK